MRHCTGNFNIERGIEIDFIISKPADFYGEDAAKASERKINMLIDTGASKTVISSGIVHALGLDPVGKDTLKSVTQDIKVNNYIVDLTCTLFQQHFYLPSLKITALDNFQGWRDGILGRDFLGKVHLEVDGRTGTYKLTY